MPSEKNKLLEWRNTGEVNKLYKDDKDHHDNCKFTQFDICEFYPSITESLLEKSLQFACSIVKIPKQDIDVIYHARKSLLFSNQNEWVRKKKDGEGGLFDVTMGCYDGAEICELVGLYLLNEIESQIGKADIGLYRDDGLAMFPNLSGPKAERMRKDLIEILKRKD